jgi:hypothetical protein
MTALYPVMSPDAVRDNATDDPTLTDTQRLAIAALPDDIITDALNQAFHANETLIYTAFDTMIHDATGRLTSILTPLASPNPEPN